MAAKFVGAVACLSTASGVSLRKGQLASEMQPDVVADSLAKVEDQWRSQTTAFLNCGLAHEADQDCTAPQKYFEHSCGTIVSAVLKASSGEKGDVVEYMNDVCSQPRLEEWHKATCFALSKHITTAMSVDSYSNRNTFDAARVCTNLWAESTKQEGARLDEEQKLQAATLAAQKKSEEENSKKAAERRAQVAAENEKRIEDAKRKAEEAEKAEQAAAEVFEKQKAHLQAVSSSVGSQASQPPMPPLPNDTDASDENMPQPPPPPSNDTEFEMEGDMPPPSHHGSEAFSAASKPPQPNPANNSNASGAAGNASSPPPPPPPPANSTNPANSSGPAPPANSSNGTAASNDTKEGGEEGKGSWLPWPFSFKASQPPMPPLPNDTDASDESMMPPSNITDDVEDRRERSEFLAKPKGGPRPPANGSHGGNGTNSSGYGANNNSSHGANNSSSHGSNGTEESHGWGLPWPFNMLAHGEKALST